MSWVELRSVALVGTEKRQITGEALAVLPPDATSEVQAMHHAALFSIQRLAGSSATTLASTPEAELVDRPAETNAPREAVQLIELILGGNVVPPSMQAPLLSRWLAECDVSGCVLPHRVVVQMLDAGTRSKELRTALRPVLGHRGRWLAEMDARWTWAVANTESTADASVDEFATFPVDAKSDYIGQLRAVDPAKARSFLETVFTDLDAAERSQCTAAMTVGLSHDDEPFLEARLTDGSKNVRMAANDLLDGLSNSRRAQRMVERVAPLVSADGRIRKNVTVAWPDAPSKEDASDMPDRGDGSVEARWLQAIVAGTPLSWWEERLGARPNDILGRKLTPQPELLVGWSKAALAQRSVAWADALVSRGHVDHRTVEIASDDVLVKAISKLARAENRKTQQAAAVFLNRANSWSVAYGEALVSWVEKSDPTKVGHVYFEAAFAERLDPQLAPRIERLIDKAPNDHQQQSLRRLFRSLSMHTSISNAFSEGATQ